MTYYAEIKEGVVSNIVVADSRSVLPEGVWVETTPENQAYIGKQYIDSLNKFIGPQPFASWQLDESYTWVAPKACPVQGWVWLESTGEWVAPAVLITPVTNKESAPTL